MSHQELYDRAVRVVRRYRQQVPKGAETDIFGDVDIGNKLGEALAVEQAVIAVLDLSVHAADRFRQDVRR